MKPNQIELKKLMTRKSRRNFAAVVAASLLLGAVVTTGAPRILSDYFTWSPKVFAVDSKIVTDVVDQMRLEGDKVLKDIEADEPNFAKNFTARASKFSSVAMNSIVLPYNVIEGAVEDLARAKSSERDSDWTSAVSYIIGKSAKNLIIFTIENTLATLSQPSKPMPYKYKFCELDPTNLDSPCDKAGIEPEYNFLNDNSREYIFARRFISHPLFVERMCPSAKSFTTWLLNFGWAPGYDTPAQKMVLLKTFFDQLDTELEDLKHVRKAPRKKSGALPLDPQIADFLMRRTWDGGVPWVEAVADCSRQLQQEFLTQSTATSPIAESKIAEILPLRIAGTRDSSAVMPSFEPAQLYRLIRTLDATKAFPENVYIDSKGVINETLRQNYESTAYLDTISGMPIGRTSTALLNYLDVIDVVNRYAALTESAFNEMMKFNPGLFDADENFCVRIEPLANPRNQTAIRFLVHTMGKLQTVNPGDEDICFPYVDGEYKSILYFMRRPK